LDKLIAMSSIQVSAPAEPPNNRHSQESQVCQAYPNNETTPEISNMMIFSVSACLVLMLIPLQGTVLDFGCRRVHLPVTSPVSFVIAD